MQVGRGCVTYVLDLDNAPVRTGLRIARTLHEREVVGVQSHLDGGERIGASSQFVELPRTLVADVLRDRMGLGNQGVGNGLDGLNDTGQLDSAERVKATIIVVRGRSDDLAGGEGVLEGAMLLLRATHAAVVLVHVGLDESLRLYGRMAL